MIDFNYILEGSQLYTERQNKEMKKAGANRPGKVSIDNIGGLKKLPGIQHIKKKR